MAGSQVKDVAQTASPHESPENNPLEVDATVEKGNDLSSSSQDLSLTAAGNSPLEQNYLDGLKLVTVLAACTMIIILAMLDIAILGTAIPQITSDFNRLQDVGWYPGAYLLTCATVQPLTGKIFTHFKLKWPYLIFVLIFEIGSAICGAAQSSAMLIIGRAISGIGGSGLMNGTITIVQAACRPQTRPLHLGIVMGFSQIGIVLGPVLGGVFTEHASWRWCFYINLPLGGIASLFVAAINIPEQIPKEPLTKAYMRTLLPIFDLAGFALFAPASVMLLLALQFGADGHWGSARVIGLFCGSGVMAILFLFWERRMGDNAMLPLSLIRNRVVWSSALTFGMLMLTVTVGSSFLPIYLQSVKGLSPTMSGVYMLGQIIPQIFFILLSGALISKLGYYIVWAIFASGVASVGVGLVTTWNPSTSLGQIIGFQVLMGARGAGLQIGMVAMQHALPPKVLALATGILVFCQNIFGAIFVSIANAIFQKVLLAQIAQKAPNVDPNAAIAAGGSADAVRQLTTDDSQRDGLLDAYSQSFVSVFYMLTATTMLSLITSFGMGFVDIREKPKTKDDKQDV